MLCQYFDVNGSERACERGEVEGSGDGMESVCMIGRKNLYIESKREWKKPLCCNRNGFHSARTFILCSRVNVCDSMDFCNSQIFIMSGVQWVLNSFLLLLAISNVSAQVFFGVQPVLSVEICVKRTSEICLIFLPFWYALKKMVAAFCLPVGLFYNGINAKS